MAPVPSQRRVVLASVLVAGAILVPTVAPAQGAPTKDVVRDCFATPKTGPLKEEIFVTSSRNLSCSSALKDISPTREFDTRFKTKGGYSCKRTGKINDHSQWRCSKGTKAYRFESHP